MEKLETYNIDIKNLLKNIENLLIGEEIELKELYSKWNEVRNKTKVGKVFKELVNNGVIKQLVFVEKKSNNHLVYKRIK